MSSKLYYIHYSWTFSNQCLALVNLNNSENSMLHFIIIIITAHSAFVLLLFYSTCDFFSLATTNESLFQKVAKVKMENLSDPYTNQVRNQCSQKRNWFASFVNDLNFSFGCNIWLHRVWSFCKWKNSLNKAIVQVRIIKIKIENILEKLFIFNKSIENIFFFLYEKKDTSELVSTILWSLIFSQW